MDRRKESLALAEAEEIAVRARGYIVSVTLGKGSFSKVKKAECTKTQTSVALKIINRKKVSPSFRDKFLPRELEIIQVLDHPSIVKVFDIFEVLEKVIIVMELAPRGDLLDYIKLRGPLKEPNALFMYRQIVGAVHYLHKNNIVHRDLKCENVLLDHNNYIKLNDFGFARFCNDLEKSETYCGTASYTPPEVLMGTAYDPKRHDVWALGVILYIMVCATFPYSDKNVAYMVNEMKENKVYFYKCRPVSRPCKQLIRAILDADVKRRATLSGILMNSWMRTKIVLKECGKSDAASENTKPDVTREKVEPADATGINKPDVPSESVKPADTQMTDRPTKVPNHMKQDTTAGIIKPDVPSGSEKPADTEVKDKPADVHDSVKQDAAASIVKSNDAPVYVNPNEIPDSVTNDTTAAIVKAPASVNTVTALDDVKPDVSENVTVEKDQYESVTANVQPETELGREFSKVDLATSNV